MQLKCKQQMEKINSLTKKLAKRKSQQKPNNNFKLNKLFVKNEAKIKTISDNSSLNGNIYLKINFKNDNKEEENTLPHIFLTEKSNLPKEKNINKNNIIYKRKEKNKDNYSNESSIDEVKTNLNNSFALPKSKNFLKYEIANETDEIPSLSKEYPYKEKKIQKNNSSKDENIYRNGKYKYGSIKHFKTHINNERPKRIIPNLKVQNIRRYNRNNISINNKNNNSFTLEKNLTSSNIITNENIYKKIKELKNSKSIEVKRKKIDNSSDNNKESLYNIPIKKIIIIKKKPKNNNQNKNIISQIKNKKGFNNKDSKGSEKKISYDFIINNDKIYYNNNKKKDKNKKDMERDSSSVSENDFNNNYIFIKNEEKIKNILYSNKNFKHI